MASMANTIAGNRARGSGEPRSFPRCAAAVSLSRLSTRQARAKLAYKILQAAARALRHSVAVLTLIVPVSYFIYALLASGVLRQDLILGSFRTVLEAIVLPGKAIAARIFAVPMVFHGLDLVLLGWCLITLVLREIILEPFRKLETWLADKVEMAAARPPRRRRVCPFPQPRHT